LYTLDKVYLFQCQRYWRLNQGNALWRSRDVPDHTAPCAQEDLLTDTQAKALLLKHLVDRDYPETAFEAVAAKEPVVSWPP
jgi:hypothetical protein